MEVRVCAVKRSDDAWKKAIYLKDEFGPMMDIPIERVRVDSVVVAEPERGNRPRRMHAVFVTVPDDFVDRQMSSLTAIVASWRIR
jgi:Tfp pilus assembly PilM family ATPase